MAIDIDEAKVQRNEFALWLGWTLATTIGMLLGLLPFLLFIDILPLIFFRIAVPIWAGILVGSFQWFVLRRYLTSCSHWILNVGAGWALGFALGLLVIEALNKTPLGALVGYIIFGLIIALIQWPVLRREIPHVIPWVIASILGWALGAYLSQWVLNLIVAGDVASQAISSLVISTGTGLVAGAITGLALVWIVRQPERPVNL